MTNEDDDGRLNFDAAVQLVKAQPERAAFAAVPVFGDNDQTAEGARVFVVESDGAGGYRVRFVAGPFFANAVAANDILAPDDVPDRVKELRFMPTRLEEEWLDEQVQMLIRKLMEASGQAAPQMPAYEEAPVAGGVETAVPISFIRRREDA